MHPSCCWLLHDRRRRVVVPLFGHLFIENRNAAIQKFFFFFSFFFSFIIFLCHCCRSLGNAAVFNPHLAPSWSLDTLRGSRRGPERRSFSVTAGGFKLGCCFSCCSNGFSLSLFPPSAISRAQQCTFFFFSKEAPKSGEREKKRRRNEVRESRSAERGEK